MGDYELLLLLLLLRLQDLAVRCTDKPIRRVRVGYVGPAHVPAASLPGAEGALPLCYLACVVVIVITCDFVPRPVVPPTSVPTPTNAQHMQTCQWQQQIPCLRRARGHGG